MRANVTVQLSTGEARELGPGDVMGRGWTAALSLRDPFISEAHALVSLRDGALMLVGLCGRFVVEGRNLAEVTLHPGQVVALSENTSIKVLEVQLPEALLALEHPDFGIRVLSGVMSVVAGPPADVLPGDARDAAAIVWGDGLDWFLRAHGAEDRALSPGDIVEVGGLSVTVALVPARDDGNRTASGAGRIGQPMSIIARYDSVHLHLGDQHALVLDGLVARIVSDLAVAAVPMAWTTLAAELWPDEDDPAAQRRNWDGALARLRRKLRDAGLRQDLVRPDYRGNFELVLHPGDVVHDET